MIYDISVITWLRKTHNILGVLIGTLPQIPSQNVFLGLPLELLPEEARLLVEKGVAYVVDDLDWQKKRLSSFTPAEKDELRANLRKEGLEIARDIERKKQARSQQALKRTQGSSNKVAEDRRATAKTSTSSEGDSREDPIFGEQEAHEERTAPSSSPFITSSPQPWAVTPASLTHSAPQPRTSDPPNLPPVDSSSYALFKHLHDHGYFMTPGLRFGCQFSVYPGDPLRFHSHFLAVGAEWDEEIDLLHLVGGGRLGTGVKKGWMIGGVEENGKTGAAKAEAGDGENSGTAKVRTFCIEWGGM